MRMMADAGGMMIEACAGNEGRVAGVCHGPEHAAGKALTKIADGRGAAAPGAVVRVRGVHEEH